MFLVQFYPHCRIMNLIFVSIGTASQLSFITLKSNSFYYGSSKGDDESLKESEEESMSFSASSLPAGFLDNFP